MSSPPAPPVAFERDGIAGPLRVIGVREAAMAVAALELELQRQALYVPGAPPRLAGWHHWCGWVQDIAALPVLVRAVEDRLGAPCRIWASELWIKLPRSAVRVPWHQDDVFWPSDGGDLPTVSAWIALSEATPSNGGLQLVRGSHGRRWRHAPVDASRGGLDHGIDPAEIPLTEVFCPSLSPGEAVLFDSRIVHGSPENPSARGRMALSLRYTRADASGSSTYDHRPPA